MMMARQITRYCCLHLLLSVPNVDEWLKSMVIVNVSKYFWMSHILQKERRTTRFSNHDDFNIIAKDILDFKRKWFSLQTMRWDYKPNYNIGWSIRYVVCSIICIYFKAIWFTITDNSQWHPCRYHKLIFVDIRITQWITKIWYWAIQSITASYLRIVFHISLCVSKRFW
jgi:hypothetical protein